MTTRARRTPDPLAAGPKRGSHWDLVPRDDKLGVEPYPFAGFVAREPLSTLRSWFDIGNFRGGAVLVTGCRGSGKSSAVNRALYDASILARGLPEGDLPDEGASVASFYRSFDELTTRDRSFELQVPQYEEGTGGRWQPTLVVEVPINLARPISTDALVRRIVRSLYAGLVRAGVAGLAPELVASAREACIRTVSRVQDVADERLKQSFSNNIKVSLKDEGAAIEAGVSAQMEIELARKITLEFPPLTREEMDEHLLRLLEELDGTLFSSIEGLSRRLGRAMDWARWIPKRAAQQVQKSWWGEAGVAVHVVFVLDELDKLEPEDEEERAEPAPTPSPPPASPSVVVQCAPPAQAAPQADVHDVRSLATAIKPILASGRASFVVVAGPRAAADFVRSEGNQNGVLSSVFNAHVHFGVMSLHEAWEMVALVYPVPADSQPPLASGGATVDMRTVLVAYLLMESRGSFTRMVALLRELRGSYPTFTEVERFLAEQGPWRFGHPLPRALLVLGIDRLFFTPGTNERRTPLALGGAGAYLHPVFHDELYRTFLQFAAGDLFWDEPETSSGGSVGDFARVLDLAGDANLQVPFAEAQGPLARLRSAVDQRAAAEISFARADVLKTAYTTIGARLTHALAAVEDGLRVLGGQVR